MVNIRHGKLEDIERIIELEKDAFGESLGKDLLTELITKPFFKVYCAVNENDEVIGYMSSVYLNQEAEIYNFVVDKSFRNKGIGKAIMSTLFKECADCKKTSLDVRVSNTNAITFYEKFGFVVVFKRENYYANGEDALVMVRESC